MGTWTGQMGYPVLQVDTQSSPGGRELVLSQERFLYDRGSGETPEDTLWQIPLGITQGGAAQTNSPAVTIVMSERQSRIPLAALGTDTGANQWFKVNPLQTGFFRVNYAPEDWERLMPVISSLELPATDRLGLQNDAYALSRAGILPVSQFLTVAAVYQNEDDASVWSDLASNLRDVENLIADEPYYQAYRSFARDLFRPAAARIGWDARPGEGHLDALLRSTVLGQAGSYGDTEVLEEARGRFASYLQDPASLHPDLRGLVYSLAAQTGERDTYDQLWELAKNTNLQEEHIRLLLSLARFASPDLLQETLERSLTDDVRSQDTITVVTAVAGNLHGRELAWSFVKDRWEEFDRRYGGGGFGLMRLVSICGAFADAGKLADVESFFQQHPVPAAERTIRQSLERIQLNIGWLERNGVELSRRFSG